MEKNSVYKSIEELGAIESQLQMDEMQRGLSQLCNVLAQCNTNDLSNTLRDKISALAAEYRPVSQETIQAVYQLQKFCQHADKEYFTLFGDLLGEENADAEDVKEILKEMVEDLKKTQAKFVHTQDRYEQLQTKAEDVKQHAEQEASKAIKSAHEYNKTKDQEEQVVHELSDRLDQHEKRINELKKIMREADENVQQETSIIDEETENMRYADGQIKELSNTQEKEEENTKFYQNARNGSLTVGGACSLCKTLPVTGPAAPFLDTVVEMSGALGQTMDQESDIHRAKVEKIQEEKDAVGKKLSNAKKAKNHAERNLSAAKHELEGAEHETQELKDEFSQANDKIIESRALALDATNKRDSLNRQVEDAKVVASIMAEINVMIGKQCAAIHDIVADLDDVHTTTEGMQSIIELWNGTRTQKMRFGRKLEMVKTQMRQLGENCERFKQAEEKSCENISRQLHF